MKLAISGKGGVLPTPLDVPLLGTVPRDEELIAFEFSGRPLVELGDESPVYRAVAAMIDSIL